MRLLLTCVGLFIFLSAGFIVYVATSNEGSEYDLKLVLPIDTRQMPKLAPIPEVASQGIPPGGEKVPTEARAEAGSPPRLPYRAPVRFDASPGSASEARAGD